jgi:alkanesulfonate monooxygenase SsuD/methylene tetrahydromethanopterin reductase-like flavin-dependent oxidoreductase (luciferase family)
MAMELAAIDQLSGGRAILGLGASIRLWIEEQMGYVRDTAATPSPTARILLTKPLWTQRKTDTER